MGFRASVFTVWSFTATENLGLLGLEELRPARDSHYPGEGPHRVYGLGVLGDTV